MVTLQLSFRAGLLLAVLLASNVASAQTTGQLWGNVTLDWVRTSWLTYSVDFEPKILVSAPPDEPGWRNLDVSPSIQFSVARWLDVISEATIGETKQTDDVNSTEFTVRGGGRFHLFSRQERLLFKEHLPKRRLVLRDLVRMEWRHFSYSNDNPSESTARFRNRLEMLLPVNRPSLGDDGAVYLLADWEWFIPVSDQDERFANRQRVRGGVGYRRSRAWRFTALYMRTRSRDTTDEPFTTSENILNLQVKRVW